MLNMHLSQFIKPLYQNKKKKENPKNKKIHKKHPPILKMNTQFQNTTPKKPGIFDNNLKYQESPQSSTQNNQEDDE